MLTNCMVRKVVESPVLYCLLLFELTVDGESESGDLFIRVKFSDDKAPFRTLAFKFSFFIAIVPRINTALLSEFEFAMTSVDVSRSFCAKDDEDDLGFGSYLLRLDFTGTDQSDWFDTKH
jgi:hypothetical protein